MWLTVWASLVGFPVQRGQAQGEDPYAQQHDVGLHRHGPQDAQHYAGYAHGRAHGLEYELQDFVSFFHHWLPL
jgi:hypothetical protein